MNYSRIYNDFMSSRKLHTTNDDYHENHHIIPTSLGGDDSDQNLVKLTAREHYIAHWMLYKIHGCPKTAFAWRSMYMNPHGKRATSSTYQYAKKAWSKHMREINIGKSFSEETREKMRQAKIGRAPWNKGLKGCQTSWLKGKKMPPQRPRFEKAYLENPKKCQGCGSDIEYKKRTRKYCSRECADLFASHRARSSSFQRQKNSGSFYKGQVFSEETKLKIKQSLKGKPKQRVKCPHCDKVGGIGIMKRWHFDNCKRKEL